MVVAVPRWRGVRPDQVDQCRRMAEEGAGLRQIARVLQCSPATVRKALTSNMQERMPW